MALHMRLMVNNERVGYLEIQRRNRGRPGDDDVCLYDWYISINGKTSTNLADAPLRHRFGDGAWALVSRVVRAAGLDAPDLADIRSEELGAAVTGRFIVFEGGEGAGKTTQISRLAQSLRAAGRDPLVTREPGGTVIGADIRTLGAAKLRNLSRWATGGLEPDLVVLLDIDPRVGLVRAERASAPDRIEQEDLAFHDRVRRGFLDEATLGENHRQMLGAKTRYLVVDAGRPQDAIAAEVVSAVAQMLLDTATGRTGCLPSTAAYAAQ